MKTKLLQCTTCGNNWVIKDSQKEQDDFECYSCWLKGQKKND